QLHRGVGSEGSARQSLRNQLRPHVPRRADSLSTVVAAAATSPIRNIRVALRCGVPAIGNSRGLVGVPGTSGIAALAAAARSTGGRRTTGVDARIAPAA